MIQFRQRTKKTCNFLGFWKKEDVRQLVNV
jgi:hypothetical protein